MCGCGGAGIAADGAIAATTGAGVAGAFGPAAAAGNASVKVSVAMLSKVKNPIFFMCSSSSVSRLGRSRGIHRLATDNAHPTGREDTPATPAQYSLTALLRCVTHADTSKGSSSCSTPPPIPACNQAQPHGNCHVEPLDDAFQPLPMAAEQIAGSGDDAHPKGGTQKIEKQKFPPRHSQNSRHRPGDDPHAKHEASKENCYRPIARKQPLGTRQRLLSNSKESLVALEEADALRNIRGQIRCCRPAWRQSSPPR